MIAGVTGPSVQDGLRSYGRVITIDHGAFSSLYAHLSRRNVAAGQSVKGGSIIASSGNAGNVQSSSGNGAHLHFATTGTSPYNFTSLKKGAMNVKWDNTVANLHHGEAVLTKDLNKEFQQGVKNFANGGGSTYNVHVHALPGMNEERLVRKTMKAIRYEEARKAGSRTAG
jgi:hypothetical protein